MEEEVENPTGAHKNSDRDQISAEKIPEPQPEGHKVLDLENNARPAVAAAQSPVEDWSDLISPKRRL